MPTPLLDLPNGPPEIQGFRDSFTVMVNETTTINLGFPFHVQLDEFEVSDWGTTSGPVPAWITFLEISNERGIKFKVSPPEENAGREYEMFCIL